MRIGIAAMCAIGLLAGADAVRGDDSLQGTWKLVSGEANGKPLPDQQLKVAKLIIDGDRYTVTLEGRGTTTGVQKLDSKPKTNTIDIVDSSGPNKGETCLGIYELKGDEFRVAFGPPGTPRPTRFASSSESGYWLHVWKRMKD